jgi:thiamine pyrophosphate-dependent acetolactate synthase large subunit-like protein
MPRWTGGRPSPDVGSDTSFTFETGHIIDIYDGCGDEGVPIIDVCHERVTAHAAHRYARLATRNAMMDAQKAAT